jgi:hypothetical protein
MVDLYCKLLRTDLEAEVNIRRGASLQEHVGIRRHIDRVFSAEPVDRSQLALNHAASQACSVSLVLDASCRITDRILYRETGIRPQHAGPHLADASTCFLIASGSQPTLNPDSSLLWRDVGIFDRYSIHTRHRRGDIVVLKYMVFSCQGNWV